MASQLLIKPQQHDVFKITHETQQFLLFPSRIYSLHFKQKVLLILFFQWTEMTHTPRTAKSRTWVRFICPWPRCVYLSIFIWLSLSLYFSWSLIFKLNLLILKQISASIVIHVYLVTLRRRRVLHQNPRSPFWHNDEYNNLITKWKSANSGREKTW